MNHIVRYDLFKANEIVNGEGVFIKCLKEFKAKNPQVKELIFTFLKKAMLIKHENVVILKQWIQFDNNLYLIYEQCEASLKSR